MSVLTSVYDYLKKLYSSKEEQALASFLGEVEHLKLLNNDLINFVKVNGEDFTKYNSDQLIEVEFRISLLFSFFHVCLEYKTRTAFKSGIKKSHKGVDSYLLAFKDDLYEKLRIYRNKTFHENSELFRDIKEKKRLNVKGDFDVLYGEIVQFIKAI